MGGNRLNGEGSAAGLLGDVQGLVGLDPQGRAIQHSLEGLGFNGVHDVRAGKLIELDGPAQRVIVLPKPIPSMLIAVDGGIDRLAEGDLSVCAPVTKQ